MAEGDEFAREIDACRTISAGAKSFQFLLARAIVRRKTVGLDEPLAALVAAYDALFASLVERNGALRLAS